MKRTMRNEQTNFEDHWSPCLLQKLTGLSARSSINSNDTWNDLSDTTIWVCDKDGPRQNPVFLILWNLTFNHFSNFL